MRLEPDWWSRARRMAAMDYPIPKIVEAVGKSRSAVLYCLNERVRAQALAGTSRRWRELAARGGTTAGRIYDGERQKVRRMARDECRAVGPCTPADLRRHYRKLNCL